MELKSNSPACFKFAGVLPAHLEFCHYGMQSEDAQGKGLANEACKSNAQLPIRG